MKKLIALSLAVFMMLSVFCACGAAAPAGEEKVEAAPAETAPAETAPAEPEPEPEPEPELPDPAELWARSDELIETLESFDLDSDSTLAYVVAGQTIEQHTACRIKGSDLTSPSASYQMIYTGDIQNETYFLDGKVYESTDFGDFCAAMTTAEFDAYRKEDEIDFSADCFAKLELSEADSGWRIDFSEATEKLSQEIVELFAKDLGFLSVSDIRCSGWMVIDADGYPVELYTSIDFKAGGELSGDLPFHMEDTEKYLSINEPVTVSAPAKLSDYIECSDIHIPTLLHNGFLSLTVTDAVDFTHVFSFDGTYFGTPLKYDELTAGKIRFDASVPAAYYEKQMDSEYTIAADVYEEHMEQSHDNSVLTIDYDGEIYTQEVDPASLFSTIILESSLYCTDEWIQYITEAQLTEKDGQKIITFTPEYGYDFTLFYSIAVLFDEEAPDFNVDCTAFEPGDCAGQIVFDAESNQLLSFSLSLNDVFRFGEDTMEGTLVFEKTINALGADVAIAPAGETAA